ncbi:MAG TPA: ROK family protein [Bryobacteraceae bacterium]|jgi:glucokinase|nr:ROK family protein [Bryobacteraceae bacterium]
MVAGLDIGGTRIKAGLVDEAGRLSRSAAIPTPASLTAFREALPPLLARIANGAPISGVGIACKGIIRPEDTMVESLPGTLDYLQGYRLADFLEGQGTVRADNDARAALAGELVFGAAKGKRDVVMLTLGTGVGGGIAKDGRLVFGHGGAAGHLGHVVVDPLGPYCICGSRGCLETYFSSRAIEFEAMNAILRGCDSLLRTRFQDNPTAVTCADVFACAREGDLIARSIFDRAVVCLGAALAGIMHALDPEIVILGGQIAVAGEMLFAPLRADTEQRTKRLLRRAIPIVPATVDSGVVGAASLVMYGEAA